MSALSGWLSRLARSLWEALESALLGDRARLAVKPVPVLAPRAQHVPPPDFIREA